MKNDIMQYFIDNQFDDVLVDLVCNSVYKNDISPRGLSSVLTLIYDLITSDYKILYKKILREHFMKIVFFYVRNRQFKLISDWPTYTREEGVHIGQNFYTACLKVVKLASDANAISEEIIKGDFLDNIKTSFEILNLSNFKLPVSIIHNLVIGGKTLSTSEEIVNHIATEHFTLGENLDFIAKYGLLTDPTQKEMIIEILVLLSSLCRKSQAVYPAIHSIKIYPDLRQLIEKGDSVIRAKVCNLLGNMCRHSDFFYEEIKNNSLVDGIISCCYDNDKSTRKFACFAIGNAAFLNDKLYLYFKPSIKILVELLQDSEDNTRANSAGALGNFVRCGDSLCADIIKHRAHEALLKLAESDDSPNPQIQTIKVALFALGNFCYHQSIKNELDKIGFRSRLDNIKLKYKGEPQLLEHIDRIKKKIN